MSTSNERVWCITHLGILNFNHLVGRTHSWRFHPFLKWWAGRYQFTIKMESCLWKVNVRAFRSRVVCRRQRVPPCVKNKMTAAQPGSPSNRFIYNGWNVCRLSRRRLEVVHYRTYSSAAHVLRRWEPLHPRQLLTAVMIPPNHLFSTPQPIHPFPCLLYTSDAADE